MGIIGILLILLILILIMSLLINTDTYPDSYMYNDGGAATMNLWSPNVCGDVQNVSSTVPV